MLKGVLHIHSTYSDGEFTLAELREIFVEAGCRFACVTDHADAFGAPQLSEYLRECDRRSDDAFRFIPGLEYSCDNRMHVLGYGATSLIRSTDPQLVIRQIASLGGIAVIAHPRTEAFEWIETFDMLPDGIEVWNSKDDGRYAPRPATFALLARLRTRRPGMTAFFGQDLHWRKQYRGLFVEAECETPTRDRVLSALRSGDYRGEKDGLHLASSGVAPDDVLARFGRVHERSQLLRGWLKRAKRWMDGAGLAVPSSMKAHLRRMF